MISNIVNDKIILFDLDSTLTSTSILSQSGSGSNENEEVLYIPQSSRTGASLSDDFISYPGHF